MHRKELIELGRKIVAGGGSEIEIDEMCEFFSRMFPIARAQICFFCPEDYNARKDDISKYAPTVEEVVDKALSYKPIQ